MKTESAIILRNPADRELGFRIIHFEDDKHFNEVQRVPHFSIILISEGDGELKVDFTDHQISKGAILFLSPFQPFMIDGTTLKGVMINFHPDFFWLFKPQNGVACDGILFNIPENESTADANLLRQLKEMIELHFKTKHSGGEYAELLTLYPGKTIHHFGKFIHYYSHFLKTLLSIINL